MRLLIVTQKVDNGDPILGFFHRWIEEFSKHCEQITVICLYEGVHNLPGNVRVLSLGKEHDISRLRYILNFYRLIWRERKNYDVVFVHMNPIYVILGWLSWRVWGKKIGLWYTHKQVDLKLRIAEKLSDIIFTASRESFRLASGKIKIMGHGIDTEVFKPTKREVSKAFRIITVGRISPIKDYETLIEAVKILVGEGISVQVDIVGSPATVADEDYLRRLQTFVREKKLEQMIRFIGPISNKELPVYLRQMDLFINTSRTGSLDKAVLEAMASGVPVITSNEALHDVFGRDAQMLMFSTGDIKECAMRIKSVRALSLEDYDALSKRLRIIVEKEHNIRILIPRILSSYETTSR